MPKSVIRAEGVLAYPGRIPGPFCVSVPSFAPEPGVHVLVGLNGSGKSTFVKLLAGLLRPRRGAVAYREEPLTDRRTFRRYCAESGYLWQDFTLKGSTPVLEYLTYRAWLRGYDPAPGRDLAREALRSARLEDQAEKSVGKLSGGMQRRVGIAAETLGTPRVLLLDEPTSGLDLDARERFYGALDGLAQGQTTVVLAAHELADVSRYDATLHVMRAGEVRSSTRFAAGELTEKALHDLVREPVA